MKTVCMYVCIRHLYMHKVYVVRGMIKNYMDFPHYLITY